MSISDLQKRKIGLNINRLDYLSGTGVLSTSRKHLAKELFLIVSSGGVGRRALLDFKEMIYQQVEPEEVGDHVVFLAIDADHGEQNKCRDEEQLLPEELLNIPYREARSVISPEKVSEATLEWVHPGLFDKTNAPGYFDGSGASATRQCGRVLFEQSHTQQELYNKLYRVREKAAKLTDKGIIDPKLKVFFLVGIAGGTGSGTVVDLAFLTRHYLNQILPEWRTKTTLSAYLFLPSACSSTPASSLDAARGNKNAYACMKEINYFMTLKDRKERFEMDYGVFGTRNVEVSENIFDFCTLVEGVGNGGVFFGDGASTARKIAGLSIMNIICQDFAKTDNTGNFFLVDSFYSNRDAKTQPFIQSESDKKMPRQADYIYSVVGYASCVVPVELLTVYAFKKVFDEAYQMFDRNREATREAAAQFLKECQLDIKSVQKIAKTFSPNDLENVMESVCRNYFESFGPYYMVNLTNEAVELIRTQPGNYMLMAQAKQNALLSDKAKWSNVVHLYDIAAEYLTAQNNQLFEVYTYVIKVLRDLLEKNGKILTDTQTFRDHFGQSFQWSPIDLTEGANATRAVSAYLNDIMNPQETNRLAHQFVEDLYANRDRWTDIASNEEGRHLSFDVAEEIRGFIKEHMDRIVNTTLESFIVKAFSGNKDAQVSRLNDQGNEVPTQETIDAARIILDRLQTSSVALASTGNGYVLNNAYHNKYLTIPENCPWLQEAIEDSGRIERDNIFKSSAKDSLVMSVLYSGVPAWALTWLPTAEESYEFGDGPNEVGLHIEQAEGGRDWGMLPNLYPEGLWTTRQRALREREAGILEDVRQKMETALKKGLVVRDTMDTNYYKLLTFRKDKSDKEILGGLKLSERKRYTVEDAYGMLEDAGLCDYQRIDYVRFIMTDDSIKDPEKKVAFQWDLACRIVRKDLGLMKALKRTLDLAEAVERNIAAHNPRVVDDSQMVLFASALRWELVSYNSRRKKWSVLIDGVEEALGGTLGDNLMRMCAHFFGFEEFTKLSVAVLEELREEIAELEENASDDDLAAADERASVLKESLKALRSARKEKEAPWPDDSPFAPCANKSPWPMASMEFAEACEEKGYDPDRIRRFYKLLADNL